MAELVLHPTTAAHLQRCVARPPHAVLIVGPGGSGKASTARYLAAHLLGIDQNDLQKYPYISVISPLDGKAIPIDSIRELQHFMTLKIPGKQDISRVVIIEDAQLMTTEAQNALLKTLEEPPEGTVLILTATSTESLLSTIQSRVSLLGLVPPEPNQLKTYFSSLGYTAADIDKALLVSGNLPGLSAALLAGETDHPLHEATVQARTLLQASAYERLVLVDGLSKQRELCMNMLGILGQMARTALMRSPEATKSAERWQKVLSASFQAQEQLRHNASAKLVLTQLMLEL